MSNAAAPEQSVSQQAGKTFGNVSVSGSGSTQLGDTFVYYQCQCPCHQQHADRPRTPVPVAIDNVTHMLRNYGISHTNHAKALLFAIENSYVDLVRFLLENGVHVNYRREHTGMAALHLAVEAKHEEIVLLLLQKGADVNMKTVAAGNTPLHLVALTNSESIAQLLLDHGAQPNVSNEEGNTPLHQAAYTSSIKVAKVLLECGADPNALDKTGDSPLHRASTSSSNELAQILLNHNACPNIKSTDGMTALHRAVQAHSCDVVKILLKAGADSSLLDANKKTALERALKDEWAVKDEQMDLIRSFIEDAATSKVRSENYKAALCSVAVSNNLKLLQVICNIGQKLSLTDLGHSDALYGAVSGKCFYAVQFLLAQGPITNPSNALRIAVINKSINITQMLVEHGADVNATFEDGTALQIACSRGSTAMIELLLQAGADVNADGPSGTAWNRAKRATMSSKRRDDIFGMLIRHGAKTPE